MWPDDEWEDEPTSGSLPDPSTRHWRHPSELGAQNAMAAAMATSAMAPGPGPGWRWTAGAITGGLAVVALGVFGLTVSNGSPQEVLTAGSINSFSTQAGNVAQTVRRTATSIVGQGAGGPAGPTRESGDQQAEADTSSPTTTTTSTVAGPVWTGASASSSVSQAAPLSDRPTANDRQGLQTPEAEPGAEQQGGSEADAAPAAPLMVPADDVQGPYGPAVYAEPDLERLLGSFVPVDNQLLTSASVIRGQQTVYLLIGGFWVEAEVAATDPLTDVAVLSVHPGVWELGMPSDSSAAVAAGPDTEVFVGYCPKELLMNTRGRSWSSGCGPIEAPGRRLENEATAASAPGAADDRLVDGLPARIGTVWSMTENSVEIRGRQLYDLMKTEALYDEHMAGTALRNTAGEVVGLVVAVDNPSVAAIPIHRALETAAALQTVGQGGYAWLGIETESDELGVWVTSVDELGPAAELALPGDKITSVDETPIIDNDHMTYLVRTAGPLASITVTVTRGSETIDLDVTVADLSTRPERAEPAPVDEDDADD